MVFKQEVGASSCWLVFIFLSYVSHPAELPILNRLVLPEPVLVAVLIVIEERMITLEQH